MLGTKVSLMETYGNQTKIGVSIFEQNHEDLRQILETKMLGTSNKSREKRPRNWKIHGWSIRWAQHFRQLRGPFYGPPWFSQAAQLPLSERFFMGRLQPKRCSSKHERGDYVWCMYMHVIGYIYIGMNNFKSLSQNVVSPKVPGLPSFFPLRLIEIGKF